MKKSKKSNQANRGRSFEELINAANEWYGSKGIGLIQKIPTEWVVIRDGPNIRTAYPKQKSTVDYIGLYYNRPVAFDAKSTRNKTRFPLSNIEPHQREFLEHWRTLGGKAFFLIEFKELAQIYILSIKMLAAFEAENDRKSIPVSFFEKHCQKATQEGTNPLNYLKTLF
jgi:recombination protein U